MDRLQAMEAFVRVVEAGSFAKAAVTMNAPPSTVTRLIKELEAYLGARLLNRTTRALSLTDVGLRYFDNCVALLRDMQIAEDEASQKSGVLRGSIKIGTTPSLAKHLIMPAISDFMRRYPEVDVDFNLSDETVDVVQNALDCIIRTGHPESSRLVAKKISSFQWLICASPEYIKTHGAPKSIQELSQHLAIGYQGGRIKHSTHWAFDGAQGSESVRIGKRVSVNDTDAYISAGLAGLGLIKVADYCVSDHINDGRLIRVLPEVQIALEPISILYPYSRHLSPEVRAFIDWVAGLIRKETGFITASLNDI